VARLADLATTAPDFFRMRDGLPGRDIARLYEDHRGDVRSIYDKLHVHTNSEAVAKALKAGILR